MALEVLCKLARPPLTMLDLCSGLGGASEPFRRAGWRVVTVDLFERFHPSIVADVAALPLKRFHIDLLWASPPCVEFSRHGMPCFFKNPPPPDLTITLAVRRAIDELGPRFWIVENVLASRPWLTPIFGPTRAITTGHAFWGNYPGLLPHVGPHKSNRAGARLDSWLQPAKRALIPAHIGEVLCRNVESVTPC
jgi:hypothetical protein